MIEMKVVINLVVSGFISLCLFVIRIRPINQYQEWILFQKWPFDYSKIVDESISGYE